MPPRELMLKMYYQMQMTRAFNHELLELKAQKKIYGPIHRITGQEAMGIAVGNVLRRDDYAISNHRGFAHWIGKGIDMKGLAAEIFGKEAGCCKGKAGEMLITDMRVNLMSTTIVGGGLPLAAGLGLSIKMKKSDQVVVCFFGDGASNEGAFHEALNFAALHKLPVIYFCENNQWGLSTRVETSTSVRDIAIRSIGYGIEGLIVDGNDLLEVYDLMTEIVPKVRQGNGPILVEAKTYRRGTFSSNDRGTGYQPSEQIHRWTAKDPIKRYQEQLQILGVADAQELASLEDAARRDAHEAIVFGQEADYPPESALYEGVYATN